MTAHKVDPELLKEQLELEMGMKDAGVVRFRRMMQDLIKTGKQEDTTYGQMIIGKYIESVSTSITTWVENGRGTAGPHRAAQPFMEMLEPRVIAMLGLKKVCSQLMSDRARLSRTAIAIARTMEDEVRCQGLRAHDRKAYNGIMKVCRQKGEYKRQISALDFLTKQDGHVWERWDDTVCLHIGMAVINCIQDAITLVEYYDHYDGKKTVTCMRPTEDTDEWVRKNVDLMRFMSPMLEPMVVPPKPWVTGELKGGYWSDHIPRRPLIKTRNRRYLEEVKYAEMPKILKAVNAAQDTGWRVNKKVFELIEDIAKTNSELGDIPRSELYDVPSVPHDIATNEAARKKHRAQARKIHEDNVNLTSRRLSFLQVLNTADKYRKYAAFYCPVQLDFRSRLYYVTQLNPQGADWVKGLLEFSEGHALGEYGLQWLKIHTANLFGVDKVSYAERVQWVDDNLDTLVRMVQAPHDFPMWAEADKPFQAYAAAHEVVQALASGDPASFVSRIPVAFDGSASGIQNLSLAFRDAVGGLAVNLLYGEKPSDIYQLVVDKSVKQLEADWRAGDEETKLLAKWWLDFGITRKVTKRNCMTFPYGSKQRGFSDQILEDTLDPYIKDHGEPEINPMRLSNYLARINYAAVQSTVLKASEAMDWMQNAARMVAKEGRPVCWRTPLGMPVVQAYVKSKEIRVETSLSGSRKVLSIREDQMKPDTRKAGNSISPNVVHSLDASHLMLTVSNATDVGIDAFALVHDSFGTHAGKSEEFYDVIRESFVELYAGDVFAELATQFKDQVNPRKHKDFPALPTKGNLDPNEVLNSLYCFA